MGFISAEIARRANVKQTEIIQNDLVSRTARAWFKMPAMGGCLSNICEGMTLEEALKVNLKNMQRMEKNVTSLLERLSEEEKENQELRGQRDAIREFLGLKK